MLASRAVKERKIANLTRDNNGRFKLSVSNVISNAVIESLLMKPSELPGARRLYRLTNHALAQIRELWQYAGEDELPPDSLPGSR